MRSDFKKMEEEMENLVVNMGEITEFNEKINFSFKDGRKEISRLSDIDTLLKKVCKNYFFLSRIEIFFKLLKIN
jgi:vacuolar protein sorting-associated protein 51